MFDWVIIGLIVVGVIAIFTLLLSLFFSFGDHTKYRYASAIYRVDSQEFLEAFARLSNSPLEYGEDVTILKNGDEFLPTLLNTLKRAEQSITFTTYIWEDGEMSDMVFDCLIERAKAGIEVRLLLDGFGGFLAPQEKLEELKKVGGKVAIFRKLQFGKFTRIHKRNHRRAIVVDGKVGFTGGMAIADKWLHNAESKEYWRDTMFEVRGIMARSLQAAFAQLWAGTAGEILIGLKFYPDLKGSNIPYPSQYVSVISSPASDTEPLSKLFWLSIASAQNKIYITSSYIIPDYFILRVLKERSKAGVDVRLLLPNHKTDAKPIRRAIQYYYEELLKAGIKIYEYQPTMMHSKSLIVDGKWSIIGSANMDLRSVALNEENIIGILNIKFGEEVERMFFEDLEKSKEIILKEWQKRSLVSRLLEILSVKISKQY